MNRVNVATTGISLVLTLISLYKWLTGPLDAANSVLWLVVIALVWLLALMS